MKRTPVKIRNLYLPNKALDKTMEEYRWKIIHTNGRVSIFRTNDSGKGIYKYFHTLRDEREVCPPAYFSLAGKTRRQARYWIHKWFDEFEVEK